jgi:hypothetical protein
VALKLAKSEELDRNCIVLLPAGSATRDQTPGVEHPSVIVMTRRGDLP